MHDDDAKDARLDAWLAERPRLLRLAYRYLGSVGEAEDVVQEAWLRLDGAAGRQADLARYLSRIVTNLCLDRLKSARARRETYVGPWLPEPLVERAGAVDPETGDAALDISFGVMRALERLSPHERAALFLRDLYDLSFEEIAETIARSPVACRQLVVRARRRLKEDRKRFDPSPADIDRFVGGIAESARSGDIGPIRRLLAADVEFVSDGGGKATAALNVVEGDERVARLLLGLVRKAELESLVSRPVTVNGSAGLVVEIDGRVDQTLGLALDEEGRIAAIYVVRNPDKLAAIGEA